MVATYTRACLVVAAVVTLAGCPEPVSQPSGPVAPAQPSGPVAPAQPSGPSIKKVPEAAALLKELIGVDAFVYEFSGCFLEVWLEIEVEDVATKEKQTQTVRTHLTREHFYHSTGPIAQQMRGNIVMWRDRRSALSLRISGEVGEVTEGKRPSGRTSIGRGVQIPSIPGTPIEGKGKGEVFFRKGWRFPYAPDVIKLPTKVGEPFTIVRYEKEKNQFNMQVTPLEETVLGKLTVRLKGRLLTEEVPAYNDQPDDAAAVAALEKVGAYFDRYDTRSVLRVSFGDSSQVTDDDLAHLKKLPNLKELSLPDTITNEGLIHVGQLAELRNLSLRGPQITDAGLQHLKGLTRLERLHFAIDMTGVTDEGKAELLAALPNATISLRQPGPPVPSPIPSP